MALLSMAAGSDPDPYRIDSQELWAELPRRWVQSMAFEWSDLIIGAVGGILGTFAKESVAHVFKKHVGKVDVGHDVGVDILTSLGAMEKLFRACCSAKTPENRESLLEYSCEFAIRRPNIKLESALAALRDAALHRHLILYYDSIEALLRASASHRQ